MKMQEACEK